MSAPAVQIEALTKVFRPPLPALRRLMRRPADEVRALNNLSLDIEEGEIFGLVGRNGQGKTTLLKTICALIRPTSGSVRVFGFDAERQGHEARLRIGLVASEERSFYYRLTGRQNELFFARLYGMDDRAARRRIDELAEWLGCRELLDRRYQELSTGNKQRLAILRALLADPPLLLLDEPTRSLDPLAAEELRKVVSERLHRQRGKTILITSHNLDEVEHLCDRVGVLHRGSLRTCATMEDLRRRFLDREEITLRLRGAAALNGLGSLAREIPGLAWTDLGEGRRELRFTRKDGDALLNLAIDRARAAGAEIEACHTRQGGLKDIMSALEN